MAQNTFKVKPVRRYEVPRYPSMIEKPEEQQMDAEQSHSRGWPPLALAIVIILITLGLIACVDDKIDYRRNTDGDTIDGDTGDGDDTDGDVEDGDVEDGDVEDGDIEDGDILDGDIASCQPEDLFCDAQTLYVCNEDSGEFDAVDCNGWCKERYGYDAYSTGCDAETYEPCQCETDVLDGIAAECTPGEAFCDDEYTYAACNDGMFYEYVDCNEWCREQYGEWGYSLGCDASAEEACQCQYDIIDGDVAECTPGDIVYCSDDQTAQICQDDHYSWQPVNCEEYCAEEFGPDYISYGCNAEAENFCGCEYGIVDGEPVECAPGEQYCEDNWNVAICNAEDWPYFESMNCDQYCQETYGPDYWSNYGCQSDDPDGNGELCNCEYGILDGGIGYECYPGEVYCDPDENIVTCCGDEYGGWWVTQDCDELCHEANPGSVSLGCDQSAEDPCLCKDPEDNK